MSPLKEIFSDSGVLSRSAPGYRFRPGQLDLSQAIEDALQRRSTLIAEAGTGVGKTFAYLVPLMLSQGRSIVSTATRHLQDQLYERDLPRLKSALGASIHVAVLKGRANYLCTYRLERQQESGRFSRPEDARHFSDIVRFAGQTRSGDIAECTSIPETAPIWSMVTSTRENCLGQQCPNISDCHVMAARDAAAKADLLVINHHLLCADMALRDEGFGELLPTVDHIVIDEAHALPEIATAFFSESISTQALSGFARDCLESGLAHARDGASWPDLCGRLEQRVMDLRAQAGTVATGPTAGSSARVRMAEQSRLSWDQLDGQAQARWLDGIAAIESAMDSVQEVLLINAERHPEIAQLSALCSEYCGRLAAFKLQQPDAMLVRWMEVSRHGIALRLTPYEIAERFQQELTRQPRAWIMVSATLAIGGRFDHFSRRLGLQDAQTLIAESPFDFSQQGLLLVPQRLPDPKAPDLIAQLLAQTEISALLDAVSGGVFILCTSHRGVSHAAQWAEQWGARHPDRLVLVQGQAPRPLLIDQFRAHGAAVLIGSHSFWEGVDVPGRALSLVLIDKLPFAPPDDPVLRARSKWMEQQGIDPFSAIQVPEAAILLKQGVGRLIRSESDRGLIVIGDSRLAETGYGRRILRSLPAFARTRAPDEAFHWLTAAGHSKTPTETELPEL